MIVKPAFAAHVGEMFDGEVLKACLKTVTVRAGSHDADHYRVIVL